LGIPRDTGYWDTGYRIPGYGIRNTGIWDMGYRDSTGYGIIWDLGYRPQEQ
jgi:hypothetical protein